MDIQNIKTALRNSMLTKRAAMGSDARRKANSVILDNVISLPEYQRAETLFCYVSVSDEPDTHALLEDAWKQGKRVCVPQCASLGIMHAVTIRSMDDLQKGKYAIPEPKEHCALTPPNEIDLTIVPCVCCSVGGYRLGYGGGFYDRWLAAHDNPAAVLCYEEMLVSAVPRESHDQRVALLVSSSVKYFKESFLP